MAMATERATSTPPARVWRCWHCGRFIGRVVDRVLHEANGNKSGLPAVRRCPGCGKRNVRL